MNEVLKSKEDVEKAIEKLKSIGLYPHYDVVKSWDTHKVISFIKQNAKYDDKILDVGCNGSPILPMLRKIGFRNLFGCDLNLKSRNPLFVLKIIDFMRYKNLKPIIDMFENKDEFYNLTKQNLENTSYESESFDFITSLSVMEHGVNVQNYFSEMNRLLKPVGFLLTSTDYWPEKIETSSNVYQTDQDDTIFDKSELEEIINIALEQGFKLYDPMDYGYKDKVVYWKKTKKRYTFAFFCLQKQ